MRFFFCFTIKFNSISNHQDAFDDNKQKRAFLSKQLQKKNRNDNINE